MGHVWQYHFNFSPWMHKIRHNSIDLENINVFYFDFSMYKYYKNASWSSSKGYALVFEESRFRYWNMVVIFKTMFSSIWIHCLLCTYYTLHEYLDSTRKMLNINRCVIFLSRPYFVTWDHISFVSINIVLQYFVYIVCIDILLKIYFKWFSLFL